MLSRLQLGLERLYRIETSACVGDFVVGQEARQRLGLACRPREQLIIVQAGDTVDVGLFVNEQSLANLARNDPTHRLDDGNFADFLLAIEGVSHFVFVLWRAQVERPVSALELELQAEVDKYVICLLTTEGDRALSVLLRRRLFTQFELEDGLLDEERDRYLVANANASRYSASLEERFVRRRQICEMLGELRRFYRMSLGRKLDFIGRAA